MALIIPVWEAQFISMRQASHLTVRGPGGLASLQGMDVQAPWKLRPDDMVGSAGWPVGGETLGGSLWGRLSLASPSVFMKMSALEQRVQEELLKDRWRRGRGSQERLSGSCSDGGGCCDGLPERQGRRVLSAPSQLSSLSLLFFGTLHSDGYISVIPLPFVSLLFTAICKASSDSHFAFLHFF